MKTRVLLSPHFSLDEFTASQTAERMGRQIVVEPGSDVFRNLQHLCLTLLQPIREALGPVVISSGYRPPWLNEQIGGSPRSDHMSGLAADITVPGKTALEVAEAIRGMGLGFKQLINEHGRWVHIAAPEPGEIPRRQELTIWKDGTRSRTTEGLHAVADLQAGGGA
ncbi:D-Ala-D-Ala carboxypeptidase family metallohydrolase [Desulfovibrio subterraneus]|uniref:Peptidase M15A C-terminal domain-containing protein n=1 Tax=Desulfovibrio subterraneus TaxID=2718620 RepID=A0A7J0BKE5_9BACT|nr:D-Ala-D-Ala carboxypeptidase family metallohydrolase [Desulfovibrio subterraneus]GFM34207.1 hypothetical protein DSM101010T_25720 [Desulfovibrio subterraneus]